jgi:hypothetical protein
VLPIYENEQKKRPCASIKRKQKNSPRASNSDRDAIEFGEGKSVEAFIIGFAVFF